MAKRTAEYTCTGCGRTLRGYVGRAVCPTCWKQRNAAPRHNAACIAAGGPQDKYGTTGCPLCEANAEVDGSAEREAEAGAMRAQEVNAAHRAEMEREAAMYGRGW